MNEKILIKFLNKYVDLEENIILFKEVEVKNLSFLKLREIIYSIGNLLDEDETNKVYVCSIKSG
ncbi:unknown [Firmicutes bacterium CAG:536]|nr:unknown [Firmicutes bacterium CAG:536]